MKKNQLIPALCSLLLLTASCKKKEYSATSPSPTYPLYFTGTIGGASVNLQAGANNYYMFTSYALDGNGVYDFIGDLRNKNTSTGSANSLKISIKDYRQYAVAPTTIDSSLLAGYYSFATPAGTPSKFKIQFLDSLHNAAALTYLWDFGDGAISNAHKPMHVYAHPGVYSVKLTTQSTSSCLSSLTNSVVVGQAGGHVQLQFSNTSTVNVVNFASTTGGGSTPYSFHWDFGDGNSLTTYTTPACTYTYSAPGIYAATLTRTDAANTVEVYHRNVATQTASNCFVDFFTGAVTPIANAFNLSGVVIEWRDTGGVLWTSQNNGQPAKSEFKILSVDPYQNNSSGQPTKKIHANVSCMLYNGTSTMLFSGDVVFCTAYL
jgi:PKD repeat protein